MRRHLTFCFTTGLLVPLLALMAACGEGELAAPAEAPADERVATTTQPATDLAAANDAVVAEIDQLDAQNQALKASHEQQTIAEPALVI